MDNCLDSVKLQSYYPPLELSLKSLQEGELTTNLKALLMRNPVFLCFSTIKRPVQRGSLITKVKIKCKQTRY